MHWEVFFDFLLLLLLLGLFAFLCDYLLDTLQETQVPFIITVKAQNAGGDTFSADFNDCPNAL